MSPTKTYKNKGAVAICKINGQKILKLVKNG